MAAEDQYTWKHTGPGSYRAKGYGWWISLAVMLSVMLHIGLFFLFNEWKFSKSSPVFGEVFQLAVREQTTVSDKVMRELIAEEAPVPKDVDPKKDELTKELDDLYNMEQLDVEKITLSPEVESVEAKLGVETPAMREAIAADMSSSIDFTAVESDLSAIKKKLLEPKGVTSALQPKIMISGEDVPTGVDTDEAIKKMTSDLGKNSAAAAALAKFSSLDSLIESGEPLKDETQVMFPTDLLFDYNEYQLKENAKLSLMKLGFLIVKHPKATFHIKGYTDSIGGQDFNLDLSQKRAEAVRDWVVNSLRLQGYKLEPRGYGKLDPLVPQTGKADEEALNRRVEIEIIPGE